MPVSAEITVSMGIPRSIIKVIVKNFGPGVLGPSRRKKKQLKSELQEWFAHIKQMPTNTGPSFFTNTIIKRSMVVESFLWKSFHTVLRCLFDMTRAVGFGVNSQIEIHRIGDSTACR